MSSTRTLIGCVLLATTAACDSATSPSGNAIGDSLGVTDGTNTLAIRRVEVVAREIELRRAGVSRCDSTASTDDCEYFSAAAQLVVLPLSQAATQVLTIDVPAGTYSSVRMKVHKVSDDAGDLAFLSANPSWPARQSIRVTGFYNGTAFTYLSEVNFDAEESLAPNLVVDATNSTNLTVRIDVTVWFRNGATGPLIDPVTAEGPLTADGGAPVVHRDRRRLVRLPDGTRDPVVFAGRPASRCVVTYRSSQRASASSRARRTESRGSRFQMILRAPACGKVAFAAAPLPQAAPQNRTCRRT